MNLLSKNAPLEESIAKMQNVLASVGCETTFLQENTLYPTVTLYIDIF